MRNVIVLSAALLLSQGLQAAEIGRDILDSRSGNQSFIELGISTSAVKIPLVGFTGQEAEDTDDVELDIKLGVQLQLEFYRFFVEGIEEGFSNITLGYNAYSTESTRLDIVVSQLFQRIDRDEFSGFESVENRDEDIHIGVRSNHSFGNYQLQLDASRDVSGSHDGIVAAAQLGSRFQVRNWNIHGLAGVRYFSENVLQHYFGVSDDESTATLASYDSDDGFFPTAQIGATVPISEKWVFRTSAEYSILPDAVSDSPLAQGDDMFFVRAGVYYVFQPW